MIVDAASGGVIDTVLFVFGTVCAMVELLRATAHLARCMKQRIPSTHLFSGSNITYGANAEDLKLSGFYLT